ncbi:ABC transporter permease [Dictyoglomus thermophilum]|uniref:ABC transporter permease n=1 Tax=Dictyoglomus thermophilum TaxID=14 RepID=UPI001CA3A6CA|nr:ABC transporter permease subunit [Dictyoglomus thermophilum]
MAKILKDIKKNKLLYLMILPIVIYYIIFHYIPMIGILMAFQNYSPFKGFFRSEWVGFKHFIDFFSSIYFWRVLRNTFLLSFYNLIFGFPIPIIFALLLNEIRLTKFKKAISTISLMPYFVSLVVVAGIIIDFTSTDGIITQILHNLLGIEKTNLLAKPEYFRTIYVLSEIWQYFGFSSIVYLAALTSIDPELYEAAMVDGAGRFRQMWYISLPHILNIAIPLLILRIGTLLFVGHEKILLLYSPVTYETADVISTYVYRKGLQEFNYGYSTAVGLFNSVINFILLIIANKLSRRYSETSLF